MLLQAWRLHSLSLKGDVSLPGRPDIKMETLLKTKLGFLSGGLHTSFVTEVLLVWLLASQKEKCFSRAT